MTSSSDILQSAAAIRESYAAKAVAELKRADDLVPGADHVRWRGELLATVAVIKGSCGPAEASGKDAVSGADGEAVVAGLSALGHDTETLFFALSRPIAGDSQAIAARLRLILEAVDAPLVLLLDSRAAEDASRAFELPPLVAGLPITAHGRTFIAVEDLEASLTDERAKRVAWKQMSAAKPRGPLY